MDSKKIASRRWIVIVPVFVSAMVGVWVWGQVRYGSSSGDEAGYRVPAAPDQEPRQLPGGPLVAEDPRWEWWREMQKRDPKFEWKIPIRFYGRVVDQDGIGIEDARVVLSWTNLSPEGSEQRVLQTGRDGYFSLQGVKGKRLLVTEIGKENYVLERTAVPFSFEYAAFFDEFYFEPSRASPIVYRLLRALKPSELLRREGEIDLVDESMAKIELWDAETLDLDLLDSTGPVERHGTWLLRVQIAGGGVQCTTDDVMVRAPSEGYASHIDIRHSTAKPARWISIYDGTRLYFRTSTDHYGWAELRGMISKRFMRYTIVMNPERGSKALGNAR